MAQKINLISVRLNLNHSSHSSWFSNYYYGNFLYQDVNFRDYFDLIRPPTGKTFGFCLCKFVIHHFPKRTFFHVFFLDRLSQSRHTDLRQYNRSSSLGILTTLQRYSETKSRFHAMDTLIGYHQCTKSINYFESVVGWPPKTLLF